MPSYTSFCWSLGTTSFRTREFNKKIERQLELLSEFWEMPKNSGQTWSNDSIQTMYYDFIKAQDFVLGDAPNKSKDAREKTSGLADIGLIDGNRRLTSAGAALLDITKRQAFGSDNQLRIANDSFIYLKQLCKSAISIDGGFVRPYLITAHVLSKIGALTNDEFAFLIPLITNIDKLTYIENELLAVRTGTQNIDNIIVNILMEMPNYKEALRLFLSSTFTQSLIIEIGMNRKSGGYDAPYFDLYNTVRKLVFEQIDDNVIPVLDALNNINGKAKDYWKKLLFDKSPMTKIKKEKLSSVNLNASIFTFQTEREFKIGFFKLLHLFKAKSTLSDYFDLNRRYLKTTDTIIFKNGMVDFDIVPKCYFSLIADKLIPVAFSSTDKLHTDCDFSDIIPDSSVMESALFAEIERIYGITVRDVYDARSFIENERINRFNEMIDSKFPKETLIELLAKFESRDDERIQSLVTSNADIPTIFEYIIGIIWYNVSERKVNILNALNLSLDADLLPKSHAVGGGEDMTFKYEDNSPNYPKHTMLLEVTLANSTNQRRMEMESVSRHLGDYLLKNKETEAYCLFISTFLHLNVISDFRSRKHTPYYNSNGTDGINGMKIMLCHTAELQKIVNKSINYSQLYRLFNAAFNSTDMPNEWYKNNITDKIN